ncbi:uncharacterized protein LOC111406185 [Olea europaea var. sylvestris]|uniref:uncharacterized protein LOC111406185 n=1 Tax=Olea europaea var. sylvestris TaxID=158386 RepID=UPI000C1CFF56|nr:uncharacterized protein LOC111406185 [Olea europaea var. sylvestris]
MASSRCPLVKPPEWCLPKSGRKQKKRRRQEEEDVLTRSGSKAKLNKKGTMIITCSLCGLIGHNKRYHQKTNAPQDWYYGVANPANKGSTSHVRSKSSRAKLVPRRPSSMPIPGVQPPVPASNFQFMPTPGICITNGAHITDYGGRLGGRPEVQPPVPAPLESLVEDLQLIENQEKERKRAALAKKKKTVRGSIPFTIPRKNSATQ